MAVDNFEDYFASLPSPSFLLPTPVALRVDLHGEELRFDLCLRATDTLLDVRSFVQQVWLLRPVPRAPCPRAPVPPCPRAPAPCGSATIRGSLFAGSPSMETNALAANLADLRQRVDALRGFL